MDQTGCRGQKNKDYSFLINLLAPLVVLLAVSFPLAAQQAVSARSGLVNLVNGEVLIDGELAKVGDTGLYSSVEAGQSLEVWRGAAEVLLTPGAFLRLAPESSFTMLDDRLSSTYLEIETGEALLEVMDLYDDNSITIRVGEGEATPFKKGLYYFNADTGVMRVFDGKVRARYGRAPLGSETVAIDKKEEGIVELKKGRWIAFSPEMKVEKFKTGDADDTWLYAFSENRSNQIAMANQVAVQSNAYSGISSPTWFWSPWLGGYAFLPGGGWLRSPFGGPYFYSYNGWRSMQYFQRQVSQPSYSAPRWGGIQAPRAASTISSGGSGGSVVRSAPPAGAGAVNPGRGRSR